MTCLTEAELVAFAEGALSGEDASRVNEHIAGCSSCREVLAAVAGDPSKVSPTDPLIPHDTVPLRRGMPLGRYLVLDCIGSGGMGVVYTAYDPELDRRVAIKLLRDQALSPARLQQEARAMARLNHRNVAAVYDVGTFAGRGFVAMEFLAGQTLRRWEAVEHTLAEILDVFLQAGQGLFAAHQAGVVHRDFKPDNVMVAQDGRVSVLDFGLARTPGEQSDVSKEVAADAAAGRAPTSDAPPSLTRTGAVLGTPNYMAPEQKDGRADARSDQYSFCVALHEALFGALPGQPAAKQRSVPAALRRAVEKGLHADPLLRFPSMGELLAVMTAARHPTSSRGVTVALAAVAVLVIAGAVVWSQRRPEALCTGGEAELGAAWNAQRATQLRTAMQSLVEGPARADQAVQLFDAWSQSWSAMHREACEATRVRGTQSEALLDRRMVCLETQLSQLAATTRVMEKGGEVLEKAVEAARALPEVKRCADARTLLAQVPEPTEPAKREQLERTRTKLAETKALRLLGRNEEALALANTAVTEAEAIAYAPLQAEALLEQLRIKSQRGDLLKEEPWRAVAQARLGGDKRQEAEAWVELAGVVGRDTSQKDLAPRVFEMANASVQALPSADLLDARLVYVRAEFEEEQDQTEPAIASYRQALALYEAGRGPNSGDVGTVATSLGELLYKSGKVDEGEALLRRAIAIARADPQKKLSLPRGLKLLGDLLVLRTRYDEAKALLEEAMALAKSNKSGAKTQVAIFKSFGQLESHREKYDAAAPYWQQGLDLARAEHLTEAEPFMLRGLASVELQRQHYDVAITLLQQAREAYAKVGRPDPLSIMAVSVVYTEALIAAKRVPEAKKEIDVMNAMLDEKAKTGTSAEALVDYRFLVADVMFSADYDRPRAIATVRELRKLVTLEQKLELIDNWLKSADAVMKH